MKTSTQDTLMVAAIIAAVLGALLLVGCAIPIPPSGPDMGRYGYLGITYTPNILAEVARPLPQPQGQTK